MTEGKREQDEAAGGHEYRQLRLADGTIVTASVAARRFARMSAQCYAYLQFKVHGKTVTKYVGRVTADSRAESLRLGWSLLRSRKLVESFGWDWVKRNN